MIEIRLPGGTWKYDPSKPLGPSGGFGAVYLGEAGNRSPVAVKKLHIDAEEAAHRELAIARDLSKREFKHILPVHDSGQDAESEAYYIVMPVADLSLQQHLLDNRKLVELESIAVLEDVARGLAEAPHLTHRDLKPGNVLRHGGVWKVADYGIARFVEDSTSARTLKECLTPAYAAPEQWRLERATGETDVYALGCIGYALLTGAPPYNGTVEQIREGHLSGKPSPIPGIQPQLATLLAMMLRKSPAARPSLSRVQGILQGLSNAPARQMMGSPLNKLARAGAEHEWARSQAEAHRERLRAETVARNSLVQDARTILREIAEDLADRVATAVPNASVARNADALRVRVGSSTLELELGVQTYGAGSFPRSKWDVVCGAAVGVTQLAPSHSRSASLWYTRRGITSDEYRWYEVGYMANPLSGRAFQYYPTSVEAELADRAHWEAMDIVQAAYGPVPVDGEDSDGFIVRWLETLATACQGRLQHLGNGLPHFET